MINLVFNLTVRQSLEQAQYNLSPTTKYQTVTLGFSYVHVCAAFFLSSESHIHNYANTNLKVGI